MLEPLTVWIMTNCEKLRETGIADHLPCLLRNLYVGQEATVRTLMEQLVSSGLRKEYDRAVCCFPVYLTYTLSIS